MDRMTPLQDLIAALEYGSRFHISIEFFHQDLKNIIRLPRRNRIHSTPFCDEVKDRRGLTNCLKCKGKAMDKARCTRMPYGGLCVNGVYEFCYPVYRKDNLICIVFVGNIINDMDAFLAKSGLNSESPLIDTMERNMDENTCLKISCVVASYILMLMEHMPQSHSEKQINSTIAAVQSYVDCYYYLDISLTEIARMYHYNEKYLGTLFKKQMGMSFHDYLNERRLGRAQELLQQTEDSVQSISTRVGFNNVTYFNRVFRDSFGQAPSQYRKDHKAKFKLV